MSEGRKKNGNAKSENQAVHDSRIPIGDPFERILSIPKESLVQRASSPRRLGAASPVKSSITKEKEICFEQLPRILGTPPYNIFHTLNPLIFLFFYLFIIFKIVTNL